MWDWYEPYEIRCPDCDGVFWRWQGIDGPNLMFTWRQDARHPVDHDVDEGFRVEPSRWNEFALPRLFLIEATGGGHRATATGECVEGVWRRTYLHHGSSSGCPG
jgi:hypothetical protein